MARRREAPPARPTPEPRSWRGLARELLPIALTALLILAARSSFADHYVIPSGSMEYTLMPGDHVYVDKLAYGARLPFLGTPVGELRSAERGDVVIFDSPEDGTRLIKRVVGTPGDRIRLARGRLYVDDRAVGSLGAQGEVIESFGAHDARLNLSHGGGRDIASLVVPEGRLLVIGDSRGNSRDGRIFGLIEEQSLYGRAQAVIYRSGEGLVWKPL